MDIRINYYLHAKTYLGLHNCTETYYKAAFFTIVIPSERQSGIMMIISVYYGSRRKCSYNNVKSFEQNQPVNAL